MGSRHWTPRALHTSRQNADIDVSEASSGTLHPFDSCYFCRDFAIVSPLHRYSSEVVAFWIRYTNHIHRRETSSYLSYLAAALPRASLHYSFFRPPALRYHHGFSGE